MCLFGNEIVLRELRKTYPKGTKIKCIFMDDQRAIPSGTIGEVSFIDDAGQIHVNWQTGSSLALIPGEDRFAIVKE